MSASLLQVFNGEKSFGARILFSHVTFAVNEGEHIGVIGPNGAGKTTLFKMLSGSQDLDAGQIVRSQNLHLGYLEQEVRWSDEETIESYLEPCSLPIWELKKIGRDLGLKESDYSKPINSFSGGYRMRAKLLYLMGFEPNLMFLDEPTNYLDLETVIVLENFLQGYRGAFLLISHDREFLRRTTDHIVEIEGGEATKYNGNIDDYFEQKALLREQLERQVWSQDARRKEIEQFVARFGAKATKARQAQSRLKAFQREEKITVKALPSRVQLRMPAASKTPKLVAKAERMFLGYDGNSVLKDVDFELLRGDHVAVVGYNGAGKSTLLKALAGKLALQSGSLELALDLVIGYFGQHVALELNPEFTVEESLLDGTPQNVSPQEVLDLAGALLFSGDMVKKKVRLLSGGEKTRVALGKILLKKSGLLILDEPTNHLDFDTVEALTQALEQYQGTLVTVSHDRGFVGRVAKKILEVADGKVQTYLGNYDHYVWKIEKEQQSPDENPEGLNIQRTQSRSEKGSSIQNPNTPDVLPIKEKQKNLIRDIGKEKKVLAVLEKEIASLGENISKITESLEAGEGSNFQLVGEQLRTLQQNLEEKEENWLQSSDKLEALEGELSELNKNVFKRSED